MIEVFEVYQLFLSLINSENKLRVALPTSRQDYIAFRSAFINVPKRLKQEYELFSRAICVDRRSFFAPIHLKITNSLISAGIIQYWFNYLLNFELTPLIEQPRGPQVFSIEDLKFGFFVWLAACGISISAFSVEIFYDFLKKVKSCAVKCVREFIGLIYLLDFFPNQNIQ